ncbi:MAG: hypothetical protein KF764_26375 [Labilithrix sp.]|nr:hypothetical protein [Labilithrix sp.]
MLLSPKIHVGLVVVGSVAALVIACGSDSGSEFGGGEADAGSSGIVPDGSFGSSNGEPEGEDLYANDPPPKWCGPGGDPAPPPPGGTEQCPDDKNKPGCGCTNLNEKAACWTGLRKHRNLGICKDGQTTCTQKNENSLVWGPCEGEVLPAAGATKGKEACGCFSAGQWKIANLSPCTIASTSGNVTTVTAVSTIPNGNTAACPSQTTSAPAQAWSTNTLNVDCAGHFKLCLRIRQGVFETPSANDCILAEVCAESDYKTANVEQAWPDLPGWLGKDAACAAKWHNVPDSQSAGYAEMIVKGQSVRCDAIDDGKGGDLVFNRTKYCPRSCNEPANANNPECVSCQQSGQGQF